MAINIKNDEAERLSRELARLTGETVTTAVTVAVRERLDRVRRAVPTREDRIARMLELGRQINDSLGPDPLLPEHLYDAGTGLPV